MVTCLDVARYILEKQGAMSAMKLQKLVYYAQAWSLVWDERPLFREPIKAWANGPVVPRLYGAHRGRFRVSANDIAGDSSTLDARARATIGKVLAFYGKRTAQWLSDLSHREKPWMDAREKLAPGERGGGVITHAALAEFYGSLAD